MIKSVLFSCDEIATLLANEAAKRLGITTASGACVTWNFDSNPERNSITLYIGSGDATFEDVMTEARRRAGK